LKHEKKHRKIFGVFSFASSHCERPGE